MGVVISVANMKGGVAKTTTVLALGSALNKEGKRILLIDVDSSKDLSISLGIPEDTKYTSNDIFNGKDINSTIIKLENDLHIIPANKDLIGTQMKLKKGDVLSRALEDVKNKYDYIIIDSAPSMSILNVNAIVASQLIITALEPEYLALTGLKDFLEIVKLLDDKYDIKPPIIKILITKYDQRKGLHREAVKQISKHFKDMLLKTKIRTCVKLAEAPSYFKDIFEYAPSSHASEDYKKLSEEVRGIK